MKLFFFVHIGQDGEEKGKVGSTEKGNICHHRVTRDEP
jgi:hypothetical protein